MVVTSWPQAWLAPGFGGVIRRFPGIGKRFHIGAQANGAGRFLA